MTSPAKPVKTGSNGRPVRPFVMPASLGGKLRVWRFLLLRRAVQIGVLLLFIGTVRWGWEAAGRPVLTGNLSSSELLGFVPMADPFAVLEIFRCKRYCWGLRSSSSCMHCSEDGCGAPGYAPSTW